MVNLLANATNIVFICVIAALLIAFLVWSFVSNKKKQKAYNDTINAVKPGSKVKTIGGICGEVVEIDEEENTFVLKTGTGSDVCYIKFDKQAIYQTDAKPEPAPAAPAEEVKESADEKAEVPAETAPEEKESADAAAEEKPEDEGKKE